MTSLFLHVSRLTTVGLMDEESDRHRTFNYRKQHKHTHTKKKKQRQHTRMKREGVKRMTVIMRAV